MTLTCQAKDFCHFGGTQWFTLWNLIGTNPYIIQVSTSMFGPKVKKYVNLLHLMPKKGGFWPPETKRLRVGSGHYELVKAKCISYQETLVKKLSRRHPESWTWLPAYYNLGTMTICLINAQSVRNKVSCLCDFISRLGTFREKVLI